MIDPATGWFEMCQIPNKEALSVAQKAEMTWMTRYPWPQQVILDRGREFMGEFARMMENDYGVKRKPITARNPQANAIIERVHQTIGNMIRTFQVQDTDLDEEDPRRNWLTFYAVIVFHHSGEFSHKFSSSVENDLLRPWISSHPGHFGLLCY